jgi:predicted Zn-dependent protease with MMP-like domain
MADFTASTKRAAAALEEGRTEEALAILNEVLATTDDLDAALLRSEALVLLDRWEEAEESLNAAAEKYPGNPAVQLAMADLIVDFHPDDAAAIREALALATRAESLAMKAAAGRELIGELRLVKGRALAMLGDPRAAVEAFESARPLLGDDPDLLTELGMSQFEALDFRRARELFSRLVTENPDDARVHHYLGLLDERDGKVEEAERHFRRACAIDPDEFPAPIRLSEEEFERVVEAALEGLPDRVRKYIEDVPLLVEDIPEVDDLRGDPPLSPLSLGMFRGHPGLDRSHFDPWSQLPSSIVLYQKNLERYAGSREELIDEIETTVLHEVGHYLGWDEQDLYERGLD